MLPAGLPCLEKPDGQAAPSGVRHRAFPQGYGVPARPPSGGCDQADLSGDGRDRQRDPQLAVLRSWMTPGTWLSAAVSTTGRLSLLKAMRSPLFLTLTISLSISRTLVA